MQSSHVPGAVSAAFDDPSLVADVSLRVGWRHRGQEERGMPAPGRYPEELRERVTRMAVEARRDPATAVGAVRRIAGQWGVHPEALRVWVKQCEIDEGARAGVTTVEGRRIAELGRENRELRRANAILRSASAFFAAELDRPHR